jgi:hypothetical protein
MSRSDLACAADPIALLRLRLQPPAGGADAPRDVCAEFTRPQLVDFLRRLDLMQAQLDSLGN